MQSKKKNKIVGGKQTWKIEEKNNAGERGILELEVQVR